MLVDGDDAGEDHQQDEHGGKDGLALLGVLDADTEGEAAGGRDQQQAGHLDDVGEGAGVLIRMGGVHAEEAAAVGAGLLDGDLRSRGALGQELLGDHACVLDDLAIDLDRVALDLGAIDDAPAAVCIRLDSDGLYELSLLSRLEVGDDATGSQADAQHEVQRDEHIQDGAGEVDPEGTQTLLLDLTEAADQCEHDRDTGAGGNEVLHGETHELHKVGQGGLAGIGLPVGIGDEGGRRVERQVPGHAGQVLRVARQDSLEHLERDEHHEPDTREGKDAHQVTLPAHLLMRVNAEQAIDAPLDGCEHG